MKISKALLSLSLVAGITACSTITTGTTQPLTVETPFALGASCTLVDSKGATWRVQETPQTLEVTKGDGPMTVSCSKPGHQSNKIVMEEGFAGMTVGNVIFGGVVGVAVDAASGAAQEYPDKVQVWLKPNAFASAAEKEEWESAKAAYDEAQAAKEKKQQQHTDAPKSKSNINSKSVNE